MRGEREEGRGEREEGRGRKGKERQRGPSGALPRYLIRIYFFRILLPACFVLFSFLFPIFSASLEVGMCGVCGGILTPSSREPGQVAGEHIFASYVYLRMHVCVRSTVQLDVRVSPGSQYCARAQDTVCHADFGIILTYQGVSAIAPNYREGINRKTSSCAAGGGRTGTENPYDKVYSTSVQEQAISPAQALVHSGSAIIGGDGNTGQSVVWYRALVLHGTASAGKRDRETRAQEIPQWTPKTTRTPRTNGTPTTQWGNPR